MTWIIVIAVIAAALFLFMPRAEYDASGKQLPSRRERQRLFEEADRFINQAEFADPATAASLYQSAFYRAEKAGDGLLCSEALVGLARVRVKQGQHAEAIPLLERALTFRPNWYQDKPNYVLLINRMIEEARAQAGSTDKDED
jgi:hypothetical protein